MRVTTRDPITGNDVSDPGRAPFVLKGQGEGAVKICFESEQSKREYLDISVRTPETCSINLYKQIEDNEVVLWD
jgi:hypothetical protein